MEMDEAKKLIKKIKADTVAGKLEWEMTELNPNIDVEEKYQVPLTTAKKDYHVQTVLKDTAVAHLQMQGELYYFWVESEGEIAQLRGELYRSPEMSHEMIELAKAIHTERGYKLKDLIDEYLEDK